MAPHSSTLAWKIPWMEELDWLQSMGSRRVRHNWATSLWLFTFMHWRRKWQPTPGFLPGESQGWRSLVACHLLGLHGVRQDWIDLAATAAGGSVVKNLTANEREESLIHNFGIFPTGGKGNPLLYFCLGNHMDRGVQQATTHGVTKRQTWQSN